MGIKVTDSESKKKPGVWFKNIDLRDIPYGESIKIKKLFRDPLEYSFTYGEDEVKKYLYNMEYEEHPKVSFFVPHYWKTNDRKVALFELLNTFDKGAVLEVTKCDGVPEGGGKHWTYWRVVEVDYVPPGTERSSPAAPATPEGFKKEEVEIIKEVFREQKVVPVDGDLDTAIEEVLTNVKEISLESVRVYCNQAREAGQQAQEPSNLEGGVIDTVSDGLKTLDETGNGVKYVELINATELSEDELSDALTELMEKGIAYEPKIGRYKLA